MMGLPTRPGSGTLLMPLVVNQRHYAAIRLVKQQPWFFLEARKFCHAAGNQAVYLLPVLLSKKPSSCKCT